MDAVTPSEGWGVLHLFYTIDREQAAAEPGAAKRVLDAVEALEGDGHQALVSATLGHKADLGIMALGPDLARLQAFQAELAAVPGLRPASSFVSLTETSEYTTTEEQERERLSSHGEWVVTLLADDPAALKEILYEMRFDEVSAVYSDFGPFIVGLLAEPAEAVRRAGLL